VESNTVPRVDTTEWHRSTRGVARSERRESAEWRAPCNRHHADRIEFVTIIRRRVEQSDRWDQMPCVQAVEVRREEFILRVQPDRFYGRW